MGGRQRTNDPGQRVTSLGQVMYYARRKTRERKYRFLVTDKGTVTPVNEYHIT